MKTEENILADLMDNARDLSMMYFRVLSKTDLFAPTEANGIQLNSPLWIMGHLTVTENYLLLKSTGGEIERFAWAGLFALGARHPSKEEFPPVDEVLATMDRVHKKALSHIRLLNQERLNAASTAKLPNGLLKDLSVREIIKHAIRHESSHAGHLGWLCKLKGIKTL